MKTLWKIASLFLLIVLLASCTAQAPAPAKPDKYFVPLPPPTLGNYGVTLTYAAGISSQSSELVSPYFVLNYGETSGEVGGTASERFWDLPTGKVGIMRQTAWGDYLGGGVTVVEYTDNRHCFIRGMAVMEVTNATLWQWLFKGFSRTFDRGEVALVYEPSAPCKDDPTLIKVQYGERWGSSKQDILAMGATAVWEKPVNVVPSAYHYWGFWETSTTPFDMVITGIDEIRLTLQQKAEVPSLFIVDKDSIREILGRQTGLVLYRNGSEIGKVELTYWHTLGRGPNTNLIGTGSLSRIEYVFNDGRYYCFVFLTPQVSPMPSSLVVLVNSREAADTLESATDWVALYPEIRQSRIPGVLLAVHMIGDLKTEKTDFGAKVEGGEGGSVSGEIALGTAGGISYSVIGKPPHENVATAFALINGLGKSGIDALGLYYPYRPGSGNGLNYYLSTLLLASAPDSLILDYPGLDVGVIDRIGFPDLDVFDGQAPAYLNPQPGDPWISVPTVSPAQPAPTPAP